jgi:hypothetical protein
MADWVIIDKDWEYWRKLRDERGILSRAVVYDYTFAVSREREKSSMIDRIALCADLRTMIISTQIQGAKTLLSLAFLLLDAFAIMLS